MLRSLARFQFLTVKQKSRCFEDAGKSRSIRRRERELTARECLIRLVMARRGRTGSALALFPYGRAGHHFVAWLGLPVPQYDRLSELTSRGPEHLAHDRAISDVLFSFDLFERHVERITITEMRRQRVLAEQRCVVPVQFVHPPGGTVQTRRLEVMPDAFVALHAQVGTSARTVPHLIDVDAGFQQVPFRRKTAKLLASATSETHERHSCARPDTVACFVNGAPSGPFKRLADVLAWTELELRQQRREPEASMF